MFLFPIAAQSTADTETAMDPGRPNTATPPAPGSSPHKKASDSSKWLVLGIGAVVFLMLFGSLGKK